MLHRHAALAQDRLELTLSVAGKRLSLTSPERPEPDAGIICVEPSPTCVETLRENLVRSHVPSRVLPVVAAETDGVVELSV